MAKHFTNKQSWVNGLVLFIVALFFLSFCFSSFGFQETYGANNQEAEDHQGKEIFHAHLEDTITAGNVAFAKRIIQEAEQEGAEAVLITLDTPGGLVDATFDLCTAFLQSEIPVVVYVYPTGAWAASAGAFILVSADVAVMAPATSVGAAQPVMMSPAGGAEPADEKQTQALAERMRSFAEDQGRPGDVAEEFVTENLTLGPSEALEKEIINWESPSLEALLGELDGHTLEKQGISFTISTEDATLVEKDMSIRENLQDFVSDPQISFLLLMGGMMLLYIGFSNPGTLVPEVLGALSLVMGVFGLGLFDVNTAGIVLMLLGIGLLVAEALTSGFGIMGAGGAAALLIGGLLLPLEPLMERDWYGAFQITVLGTVIGVSLILLVIIHRVILSRRKGIGMQETLFSAPEAAVVTVKLNPTGMVKARGENWKARSLDGDTIAEGEEVKVVDTEGLVLVVEAKDKINSREV